MPPHGPLSAGWYEMERVMVPGGDAAGAAGLRRLRHGLRAELGSLAGPQGPPVGLPKVCPGAALAVSSVHHGGRRTLPCSKVRPPSRLKKPQAMCHELYMSSRKIVFYRTDASNGVTATSIGRASSFAFSYILSSQREMPTFSSLVPKFFNCKF